MMNRRKFATGLVAAIGLGSSMAWAKSVPADLFERLYTAKWNEYHRLGPWMIHWTSWKGSHESAQAVGQWIAYQNDADWLWYSCSTGKTDRTLRGFTFDLMPTSEDNIVFWWEIETPKAKEVSRRAFDRLMEKLKVEA